MSVRIRFMRIIAKHLGLLRGLSNTHVGDHKFISKGPLMTFRYSDRYWGYVFLLANNMPLQPCVSAPSTYF